MITAEHNNHEFYMAKCVELAKIAGIRGDNPVGSLIVQHHKIIGEGIEGGKIFRDITFHAEIEAIRDAVKNTGITNFTGCILYTTHEPCIMCSYIIRHHKFSLVIIGVATGEIGGCCSRYPLLLDKEIKRWGPPPEIIIGIMESECNELHN